MRLKGDIYCYGRRILKLQHSGTARVSIWGREKMEVFSKEGCRQTRGRECWRGEPRILEEISSTNSRSKTWVGAVSLRGKRRKSAGRDNKRKRSNLGGKSGRNIV